MTGVGVQEAATTDAAAPNTDNDTTGLSERDRNILEFERSWWRYAGAKEQAIADEFGLTTTRYYQIINSLLDDPAALEADPMLIKRLRRMRSARQEARFKTRTT